MQITQTMLNVCEEALYLLRQDVSLPTLAAAPTDTGLEWVKCRKAFDYAAAEVLAAHDWRFARSGTAAKTSVDGWPENILKVLVYCLARELSVQIAGRTEDLRNFHQLYNRFLFDAKLKDLEEDTSSDAVCREVVATLRGYFSEESKDVPRSMVSIYERIGAVRQSSFEEVRASHGWNGGAAIAAEANLPPLAKAAFTALVCHKLAVACGLPPDAIGQLSEIYERKLVRARVADLEATKSTDAVVKEVLAAVRPFFALDQKNLPLRMLDLYERVDAVKTASFEEVKAAHEWTNKSAITDGTKLPPIARAAWITLVEAKLGVACGVAPEAVANWQNVYLQKLNQARVVDLEQQVTGDAVASEVLAGIRPHFALDQKNLPLAMTSFTNRIAAVRDAAFEEVKAAHEWTNKAAITDGTKLPPVARSAWIALIQQKLCVACGLGSEAVAAFENIWRARLAEARVVDLESTGCTDAVAKEVLAAVRPFFSEDQRNLPRRMLDVYERVSAVKDAAFEEVKAAHEWANKSSVTDGTKLPPIARSAWITLIEIKLGTVCGIPQEAIANWQNVYLQKLNQARVVDLEATRSADPVVKEVVAAVRPFFALDQKNLPLRMLDLYERVDAVKTAAFEEVKAAHEWANKAAITDGTKLPPIARAAWISLIEAKLAAACGIPQEAVANLQGVYLQRLVQARVADLETRRSDDPVVAEVLAGIRPTFAFDQKNIPMTMLALHERIGAVRDPAFREILSAHNWRGREDMTGGDDLPDLARAAWIALMQQKLCIACGLPPETASAFESIWRAKLREARVADLEASPVPEGLEGEVLTLVRDSFDVSETNLPMDLESVTARIARMKGIAMREVLSAHPWAFATEEWRVRSGRVAGGGSGEYVNSVPVPDDCLKVIGVFGSDGSLVRWEIVSGEIRAAEPVLRVTYVRDVGGLDEFSPDAYRLVVLRLAADMSRAMSMRTSVQNLHENIYRDALAEAKARDTRQSRPTAESVWGANHYADAMRGDGRA